MRVPGVVFGSAALLPDVAADRSLEQVGTWPRCPASSRRPMRCRTCTGATGSRSAGWRDRRGAGRGRLTGRGRFRHLLRSAVVAGRPGPGRPGRPATDVHGRAGRPDPTRAGPGAVWRLRGQTEPDHVLAGGARYAVERQLAH